METAYSHIYRLLGLEVRLVHLAGGEIAPPLDSMSAPFYCYGFPPALIPLWSENTGPRYAGLWKHWFLPRQGTFVLCSVDESYRVMEIARTAEQLLDWLLYYSLYVDEDGEPEFRAFASAAAVTNYPAVRSLIETEGYEPANLRSLPAFRHGPPLRSCLTAAEYHGDFPSEWMLLDRASLQRVCSLELPRRLLPVITKATVAPPWLAATEQARVFQGLLRAGDLAGAWLSLNSSGWMFSEAKKAIRQLADRAGDTAFSVLAEAWVAQPHESRGGY
jgi:hypothetical protein